MTDAHRHPDSSSSDPSSRLRDSLSRAIHADHLEECEGSLPDDDPAMQSREGLTKPFRETYLAQAVDIQADLRSISCEVVPVDGEPSAMRHLSDEEIDALARMSHDRWVKERVRASWTFGPMKNVDRKLNPLIVPWDKLMGMAGDPQKGMPRLRRCRGHTP